MRKEQKKSAIEFAGLLKTAQEHIRQLFKKKEYATVLDLLQQCQQGAIQIGTMIEETEGDSSVIVKMLEQYCELVYELFEVVSATEKEDTQKLDETELLLVKMTEVLTELECDMEADLVVRKQIVFLPYKASMWDSLESIWEAAKNDPDFDVMVVPIPYYDKNPDGSFKAEHYEGELFPEYVKVTDYRTYPLEEIRPDVIYIHNPYDHCNYITSVHPRFYSYELKKYTDKLVYVPYYSSSGGMGDGQALCSAYEHADFLVTQSETYIDYFDPSVPREKILPFGSPKFDKALRLCNNPPLPPLQWRGKMEGKRVYFFNTSISGMLADTRRFLMKMEYVFKCFAGRDDVCLLWRPHPLLESSFDSMRKEYRSVYDRLKHYFLTQNFGIYDDTPDIEKTIALCDAYIGDAGSSVISLFGIAGKPVFILNNFLLALPEKGDWRGEVVKPVCYDRSDMWQVTKGNQLYYSPKNNYSYEYYCDLSEYVGGDYYLKAVEIGDRVYVCPKNAQDILVIKDYQIVKRIELKKCGRRQVAFLSVIQVENYLFLLPTIYPAIVRYDVVADKVDYVEGYSEFYRQNVDGQWRTGANCLWDNYLLIASPTENLVLAIDTESLEVQILTTGVENQGGCAFMIPRGEEVWMLPIDGKKVVCWKPASGEAKEYEIDIEELKCYRKPHGFEWNVRPFSGAMFAGNKVILSPYWANMFVCLDIETGKAEEWIPGREFVKNEETGYLTSRFTGKFLPQIKPDECLYYSETKRRLYKVDIESGRFEEIKITYDVDELRDHEPGFSRHSQWLQYCAMENAFHTLPDFLDGKVCGNPFDKEAQIEAFRTVAAGGDGKTGERIHHFIKKQL